MSEVPPEPASASSEPADRRSRLHTEAVERRGRWPGLVWAIPLTALLVVAYLALQAVANHGFDVMVTFKTSGGALAGQTPVVYKGVTVGRVVRIRIAEDAKSVEMTLRLEPRAKSHLGQDAKFWLIGAEPSLTDLASLKAAVSGVSIGVSPGSGPPATQFIGLEQPPAVPPDTPGSLYVLNGAQIGSTREGSGVYYHGLLVGRVTRVQIASPQVMRLVIFVNAPFDKLVHPGTLFFNANAADVALTSGHFSASLGPGSSVITGGIEFDTPLSAVGQSQSPAHTVFGFFGNEFEAANQARGPEVRYTALFRAAAQQPQVGAPVWLSGERIGRVVDSHVRLHDGAIAPVTEVALEIEPASLGLSTDDAGRPATDAALRDLIRGGYRLEMGQYPPLIGTATLVFKHSAAPKAAQLLQSGLSEIPTESPAGVDDLTDKLSAILDKVNGVPIVAIGQDVRQITAHLSQLISSPELTDSLQKLDSTLTSVDQITSEVKPQVGPLITRLNQAADQLQGVATNANAMLGGASGAAGGQDANLPAAIQQVTETARSIRSLADYLGRHPEALVRGKQR